MLLCPEYPPQQGASRAVSGDQHTRRHIKTCRRSQSGIIGQEFVCCRWPAVDKPNIRGGIPLYLDYSIKLTHLSYLLKVRQVLQPALRGIRNSHNDRGGRR
jgi:hypothetical protein